MYFIVFKTIFDVKMRINNIKSRINDFYAEHAWSHLHSQDVFYVILLENDQ